MKRKKFVLLTIVALLTLGTVAKADGTNPQRFEAGEGTFLLNGNPFIVKAAELHYPRIPKEYWDNRIKLSKALGMNTICLYVFWNIHEQKEGEYNFEGQNDIRRFIELCQENDMKVILRPGPYVCAEWEMGGLPWWLLKKKDIQLRENDPYFLQKVEEFQKELAKTIGDLTIEKGGPIIVIQVENEYGSYGENKDYIRNIRDIIKRNYGDEITLFQCDWSSNFTLNGLEDLVWTMNFGTGADIDSQFKELKELRPHSPLMCSEYWSGWFDKWGANHETRSAEEMIAGIDEMLSKGISFSLYMTHGGTNWGHWAGANSPGYSPDVTSYDYDAPINENGQPTEKYYLLREVLSKYNATGEELPDIPETIKPIKIDRFNLTEVAPLWENLPEPVRSEKIKTIEEMDMGFGSVIYSTSIPETVEGATLIVDEPHDYARIFINGTHVGTLDRRLGEKELQLPAIKEGDRLDILVEAMGRINFGRAIKDFKGITGKVSLRKSEPQTERELNNWEIFLLPDETDFYNNAKFEPVRSFKVNDDGRLPIGIYKGTFNVTDPSDTFLNMENWGKGLVYVNGQGIGRFWEIGPQQTLYLPGPWLKEGENEILIFDILGPTETTVEGLDYPVVDKVKNTDRASSSEKIQVEFSDKEPIATGNFNKGNGWQEVRFDAPSYGRFVALVAETSLNPEDKTAAVAEIYVLDVEGKRLSRENWRAIADSSNSKEGNFTPDKTFDLQESTYWESEEGTEKPHYIVIDLAEDKEISGLQYLPRMENGTPGAIGAYKIYIW